MKNLKKIYLGLLTCAFLLTTLVTSTYAWFQLNAETTIDEFNVNIDSQEGLLISIDNVHFSKKLTTSQVKKAIVSKYLGVAINSDEEIVTTLEEEDRRYDSRNPTATGVLTSADIDRRFAEVGLNTVTSTDGKTMKDLFGNTVLVTTGQYVSFDLYFKIETTGNETRVQAGEDIGLYFLSSKATNDPNGDPNYSIEPTSTTKIDSDAKTITLENDLWTYDSTGAAVKKSANTQMTYHISNAVRMSTVVTDVNQFARGADNAFSLNNDGDHVVNKSTSAVSKIYELSDPTTDLGSYATNLTLGATAADDGYNYNEKYDAAMNASYTYANILANVEKNSYMPKAAFKEYFGCLNNNLDEYDYPTTAAYDLVNALTDAQARTNLWNRMSIAPMSYNADWFEDNVNYYTSFTGSSVAETNEEACMISVFRSSNDYSAKVNFNIWLEGWDADCLVGLNGAASLTSVYIQLSFTIDEQNNTKYLNTISE